MGDKLSSEAAILIRLIAMLTDSCGGGESASGPWEMLGRLEELGITPEMPDKTIEARLRKLVAAGEFVRK